MIAVFVKASVSSNHLDDFKASAQQLLAQTQAQDSGLVSYDFATLIEEGTQGNLLSLNAGTLAETWLLTGLRPIFSRL